MQKNDSTVYECFKGKNKLHTWKRYQVGTSRCLECGLYLNKEQTAEVFMDCQFED